MPISSLYLLAVEMEKTIPGNKDGLLNFEAITFFILDKILILPKLFIRFFCLGGGLIG